MRQRTPSISERQQTDAAGVLDELMKARRPDPLDAYTGDGQ
jgi:hypothetical protein